MNNVELQPEKLFLQKRLSEDCLDSELNHTAADLNSDKRYLNRLSNILTAIIPAYDRIEKERRYDRADRLDDLIALWNEVQDAQSDMCESELDLYDFHNQINDIRKVASFEPDHGSKETMNETISDRMAQLKNSIMRKIEKSHSKVQSLKTRCANLFKKFGIKCDLKDSLASQDDTLSIVEDSSIENSHQNIFIEEMSIIDKAEIDSLLTKAAGYRDAIKENKKEIDRWKYEIHNLDQQKVPDTSEYNAARSSYYEALDRLEDLNAALTDAVENLETSAYDIKMSNSRSGQKIDRDNLNYQMERDLRAEEDARQNQIHKERIEQIISNIEKVRENWRTFEANISQAWTKLKNAANPFNFRESLQTNTSDSAMKIFEQLYEIR